MKRKIILRNKIVDKSKTLVKVSSNLWITNIIEILNNRKSNFHRKAP